YVVATTLNVNANVTIIGLQPYRPTLYIIEPAVPGSVFFITGRHEVTIRDVTIQGGAATGDGGGIDLATAGVRLTVQDVLIQNNTATGNGGGISVSNRARLSVIDTMFVNNI